MLRKVREQIRELLKSIAIMCEKNKRPKSCSRGIAQCKKKIQENVSCLRGIANII